MNYPPGRPINVSDFHAAVQQLRGEFQESLNRTAGGLRKASSDEIQRYASRVEDLARVTSDLAASRSGSPADVDARFLGPRFVKDIPGRRVPYVLLVDIPIGADETSIREQSVTISQEGPFVAVKRMATFQSALEVQTTDPVSNATASFAGRSFGRYRPVHSVCDVFDGHTPLGEAAAWWLAAFQNPGAAAGTEMPGAVIGLPSSSSSFRTMEFDGRISVINAGSSYPRQNISVPSAFWAAECNSPVALGALDFFERGEVITVRVQPTHVNNPPAGNVSGDNVFPARLAPAVGGWPFLAGQYDAHEGIATVDPATLGQVGPPLLPSLLATDSVNRLPEGILTVAWEGYRIIQPVGPVG